MRLSDAPTTHSSPWRSGRRSTVCGGKALTEKLEALCSGAVAEDEFDEDSVIPDERLHLIFACCHPSLSPEARVALTLKSLGGLTTAEIARAFLTTEATMSQRLTRACHKIRAAGIPIAMPSESDLADRIDSVLAVIYLVFNEGYSPLAGEELVKADLCVEAIRLAEMMKVLMSAEPETHGLAALCLLIDARRAARVDGMGNPILLESQDRSLWDRSMIDRGLAHLYAARSLDEGEAYTLQAEIAAVHARAAAWEDTDWGQIVGLYRRLFEVKPSPVVVLNLAAAVAMRYGPEAGLDVMEQLEKPLGLPALPRLPCGTVASCRTIRRGCGRFPTGAPVPDQRQGPASSRVPPRRGGHGQGEPVDRPVASQPHEAHALGPAAGTGRLFCGWSCRRTGVDVAPTGTHRGRNGCSDLRDPGLRRGFELPSSRVG